MSLSLLKSRGSRARDRDCPQFQFFGDSVPFSPGFSRQSSESPLRRANSRAHLPIPSVGPRDENDFTFEVFFRDVLPRNRAIIQRRMKAGVPAMQALQRAAHIYPFRVVIRHVGIRLHGQFDGGKILRDACAFGDSIEDFLGAKYPAQISLGFTFFIDREFEPRLIHVNGERDIENRNGHARDRMPPSTIRHF
ncbi:MAG: hypothetical protein IPK83_24625 [Planctomycetes bacterium]|nr:hypothetical protein [Planctomycetota bacterium]